MIDIDINNLIKEAHETAKEKGWYDCIECNGKKLLCNDNNCCHNKKTCDENNNCGEYITDKCEACGGTGYDQNVCILERLALVASEIFKAVEALRKNKHANFKNYDFCFKMDKIMYFEDDIKDTFEDKIADVYIRLADLCGYLNIIPNDEVLITWQPCENKSESFFYLVKEICQFPIDHKILWNSKMSIIFSDLNDFCENLKINIAKHITVKMAYNKTLPYKNGKEF